MRNCSRPKDIVIHVLDGGITPEHWGFLEERLVPVGCVIDRILVDHAKAFSGFRTYHGNGRMAFARLLLPDLLPDVRHIIYSDVDILWIVDIAELWDNLHQDAVIHCVPSQYTVPAEMKWCEDHGYKYEAGTRFVSGVLVFNLDKFRTESLHLEMLRLITESDGKAPCNDESALNAVMFWRKDRAFLDPRWQHMSAGRREPFEHNGFVLHFLVDTPWQSIHQYHHLYTDQRVLWHRFHAEARKITLWKSMRQTDGVMDILGCRTLYLFAHCLSIGRTLLHIALSLRGKGSNRASLDCYLLPFNIRQVRRELLPS